MAAGSPDNFHHVRDFPYLELPGHGQLALPNLGGFEVTKFMILQVFAGLLTLLIFRGLAKRVQSGEPTRGRWWNFWESVALFIRDEVVRPTIGDGHHGEDHHGEDHHGETPEAGTHATPHGNGEIALSGHYADQFLPFIWSCFFYILFCNLLGAIPMLGSATGSLGVTGVLAGSVLIYNITQGIKQFGFLGFWKNQVPNIGLDGPMGVVITVVLWCIEIVGLFIKHGVLAVRLFANMMGGHTVVGVILAFCAAQGVDGFWMKALVWPASILGQILIGLLELFVAFLQAYVFAFLATIFLSAAIHEH